MSTLYKRQYAEEETDGDGITTTKQRCESASRLDSRALYDLDEIKGNPNVFFVEQPYILYGYRI